VTLPFSPRYTSEVRRKDMRLTHAEWGELELIDEIERSRRDALAALMREHEAPLYRLLVVLTGDRDVALDCVQDTFTRAYEHLRKGRTVTTPWLYKVGRNRAIDEFRRRKREQVDRDALYDIGIESTAEDMVSLRQAFAALSSDDRAILSLAGIEGLSGEEIAARLGIRHGAVRTRLQRARERFRTLYGGGQ